MAKLFDDSALVGEPWLVASELRYEARDALLLRAAPVDECFLRAEFAAHFSDRDETRWDAERRALVTQRVQRFDGIVLDARAAGRVDPAQARSEERRVGQECVSPVRSRRSPTH